MASLLDALIQVESNGNPSARGPKTRYGQALGSTQMLPGTAREMALKLGMPFRPDLLTAPTDEAKQYQRALGEAYLQEGFERTGNTRDALRYYHGGPNRAQWGPKTNAYADKVMALAGDQPMMPQQNVPPVFQGGLSDAPLGIAGMMGSSPMAMQDLGIAQQPVQPVDIPKVKTGAFGKDGKGWVIAGIIADAIAGGFGGRGGFAPTYLAAQQDERDLEQRRLERQQTRDDRLEDMGLLLQRQIALKQYDRENPAPPTPSSAAKMAVESGLKPGTPEFVQFIRRYAERPIMIGGQPYGYEDAPEAPSTQTVDGVTYYNVGGKWFDNPEGL